jgi:hypothetical protein
LEPACVCRAGVHRPQIGDSIRQSTSWIFSPAHVLTSGARTEGCRRVRGADA